MKEYVCAIVVIGLGSLHDVIDLSFLPHCIKRKAAQNYVTDRLIIMQISIYEINPQ